MRRSHILVITILILAINSFAQNPPSAPNEDEVVKITTSLIQLDVTITDKKGKTIRDVRPEEIEIYENGKKQNISNFSFVAGRVIKGTGLAAEKTSPTSPRAPSLRSLRPDQVRRTIALVVDDLTLSFQSALRTRKALKKYVDEQMRDGDLVAIVRTGGGIGALQQFTSDKSHLYAAIEKVKWNSMGRGRMGSFEPIYQDPDYIKNEDQQDKKIREDFEASLADFYESRFATGTLGALKFIVEGMGPLPGRKSVILFSDGPAILSKGESSDALRTLDFLKKLVEAATRASVVFYAVDSRGLEFTGITAADKVMPTPNIGAQVMVARDAEMFNTQQSLAMLSHETGGFPMLNTNDLSAAVETILEDQSYYLVGYEPDDETFDAKTRKFNKIEVKVKREGLFARYRSGFFNVAEESIAKTPTVQGQIPQLTKAINSPFGASDISLRLNALFANKDGGNFVTALLHIDTNQLKFTDLPEGKKAVVDILAITYGDNGVPVDTLAKSFTFNIPLKSYEDVLKKGFVCNFTLPIKAPGPYQFRVAVRDAQAETTGSASQFLDIPNLKKKRLTLSGIVLENMDHTQLSKLLNVQTTSVLIGESPNLESTDPFSDTSLRRFRRGTVLRFGYEVYNAKPDQAGKPLLKVRINVFKDNELVMEGKLQPVEYDGQTDLQRIRAGGALDLKPDMPPGDYILQIVVTDKDGSEKNAASQFVQFEVTE